MITGKVFRDMIVSGAHNIANHKAAVDELNVFPVPDGDTGTNMSMTIGFALGELTRLPDDATVDQVSSTASSALLRGARGNSGVILSLFFRGFQRVLQGKKEADASSLVRSLQKGVDAAYKAVMKPTEGTMLTVARITAEKAALQTDITDPLQMIDYMLLVANETLEETPEMLPVLKKAGVVDAGGKGFIVILEGMRSVLAGEGIIERSEQAPSLQESGRGVYAEDIAEGMTDEYCTEFLVIKHKSADALKLRKDLESVGNSVLCVDDTDLIKCHVHTETPDKAMASALKHGYLSQIKIENMLEQYVRLKSDGMARMHNEDFNKKPESFEYASPDDSRMYGFVAVSAGEGLAALFSDLGVDRTVEGGQSMNPSTNEILAAAQSIPAQNIFVLTNNKNIILSAEQAAKLADRPLHIIPTRTVPQGLSSMLAFDESVSLKQNLINMQEAADKVRSGSVTFAVRDADFEGKEIKEGAILALEGGKLQFTDTDITKAAVRLGKRLITKDTSFVNVIYGEHITEEEANKVLEQLSVRTGAGHIEFSLFYGGQPLYYYYISAE